MAFSKFLKRMIFTSVLISTFIVGMSCTSDKKKANREIEKLRIVSAYSAFSEILESIGAKDNIVGATRGYAKILNVNSIGTHLSPSLESIIACKPDVVLLSRHREEHTLRLKESLEKINVNVMTFKPETITDVIELIDTLGKIVDRQENADRINKSIINSVNKVDNILSEIPDSSKKRVFFEVRGEPNLLTCGETSIAFDIIKKAGGIPVMKKKKKVFPISTEMLYGLDIDFYLQQKGVMNKNPIKPSEMQQLKKLNAIQNGEFAVVDEKLISRPGPRVGEAVEVLYKLFYK